MERVRFITRAQVRNLHNTFPDAKFYDTSTNAPLAHDLDYVKDLSEFSPFTVYGSIPIPQYQGSSDTVEGVWQGLKVINNRIDVSYFKGKGRKRYGRVAGHQLGSKVVGYLEARKKIYVPTYEFMVKEFLQEEFELLLQRAKKGVKQFFFDVDDNGNLGDLKSPLAHSSVLVDIINKELGI